MRFPVWIKDAGLNFLGVVFGIVVIFAGFGATTVACAVAYGIAAYVGGYAVGAAYAMLSVPAYGLSCAGATSFGFQAFRIPEYRSYYSFLQGGPCLSPTLDEARYRIAQSYSGQAPPGAHDYDMPFWGNDIISELFHDITLLGVKQFWEGTRAVSPLMREIADAPLSEALYWLAYTILVFVVSQMLIRMVGELFKQILR